MGGDFSWAAGELDAEKWQAIVQPDNPFAELMGIEVAGVGPGRSLVRLKVLPRHLNSWRTLHGGVYAALADRAMGIAVRSIGRQAVTLNLQVGYLRPVEAGQVVECRGMVIHNGERIVVTEARMAVGGQPVATAGGIFYVK
ncbi:Thioesterase superfamily protein [Neomoorella glycerini]|uniref:Thioesterase superfamily protein n=1 Tax=Neomoorella glycerini TaxID=55779 RepID=A0A6I5ZLZ7_9FIRM|nr:PaaI family thioesterase [Moorella glycerini]QGP90914.1 Thioesterase superfamily protein [Moorella glycerini]